METGSGFSDNGYFGPAHRDCAVANDKHMLKSFLARFKHALLFTPKLVLADQMALTSNFQAAYRADPAFRLLLREGPRGLRAFRKNIRTVPPLP
jgi:hypothetical protein